MTTTVIADFQSKINEFSIENKKLKKENGELNEQVMKVKFVFAENQKFNDVLKEKDSELFELNKQQIDYMNKFENSKKEIIELKNQMRASRENLLGKERKLNEKLIELKKLEEIIEGKDKIIEEKTQSIAKLEEEISEFCKNNIELEKKCEEKEKENQNFQKWATWDKDVVENFKKIENLTEELNETKNELEKSNKKNNELQEMTQKLNEDLSDTRRNESKLKKENTELNIIKNKYIELEEKYKNYQEIQKQNDNFKKEIPEIKKKYEIQIDKDKNMYDSEIRRLKGENEVKISELTDKHESNLKTIKETNDKIVTKLNEDIKNLNEEITSLKEDIDKKDKLNDDLNSQLEKKTEILSNLRKSYDNLTEKIKIKEEKLQKLEKNDKKNKSTFDEDDEEKDNANGNGDNAAEKITSTFDQFSFTKEVLNDYLYCLYLFETTISIQSLVKSILGNLNLYSTYSFKISKLSDLSNCPLNSIQNELLEDVYFVAFDKFISKKINEDKNFNGTLDKKYLNANFEDFDQNLISAICIELINKNIVKKLKAPKTLEQLAQLFNTKYNKKFDFEGAKLNDFLFKQVVPVVKRRISRYDKNMIDEIRTLVELSLHNLKDGKIIIDGEEVYSFEKFFEQYNYYTNISERNLQVEIENALFNSNEAIDNIKHSLKYYYPKMIKIDKCFTSKNEDLNNSLVYMNKILASINYYLPNVSKLSIVNNKLDKIFNKYILVCIKLIPNLSMLDLSNNGLNEENIKLLFEYLKENKTIKVLYLNNNNLSSASGYYMGDSFKKNKTIEILHLSHNKLNESGFDAFLNLLGNDNKTLKELDISYNELVSQDFKSLGSYLNMNPPLQRLNISGNKLQPQDANSIGVTFKKLTNLVELKLNNCDITEESVTNVFNFLNDSNIQHLEIDSNNFGSMGTMTAIKKIQASSKLKYISYQNMTFEAYFVPMIIQALNINNSIETIDFRQNDISEDELRKLCEATNKLKRPKLIFSVNKVPEGAMDIIGDNNFIVLQ
jgi:hypothetical protein